MKQIKLREKFDALIPFSIPYFLIVLLISGCDLGYRDKQIEPPSLNRANFNIHLVHAEIGEASWYGPGFHGKTTASGEIFDQTEMTAAHPSLPMGTEVKVTNLDNGEKIKVKINDRGPYAKDRVIDLSRAAAKKLDMEHAGTAEVKIEVQ